ncbi:MAG: sodium:calcium antiporter [Spirochaetaceae bacterium]|nr:MAG: sodium:calcium antiporter [Spirochaetaceae bacterium]
MIPFGLLILGIALLYFGGENLVRSSVVLADRFGMSELVIGLTLVAFGTSSPELFVSVLAAFRGQGAVSLGNILGSNIINIALILAASAVVAAIPMAKGIRKRELPLILLSYCAAALLLPATSVGRGATRLVGLFLLSLLACYILYQYRLGTQGSRSMSVASQASAVGGARPEAHSHQGDSQPGPSHQGDHQPGVLKPILTVIVAVAALAGGGHVLVENASFLAREVFGVSERFIGLTIVAIGTSAPELATSIVAAARGRSHVVLGTIIGSNVFNTLMVLGVAALSGGFGKLEPGFGIDFAIMVLVTLVLWGFAWRGRLSRWGGLSFLAFYALYVAFLMQTKGA